jgi:hypothetical protein
VPIIHTLIGQFDAQAGRYRIGHRLEAGAGQCVHGLDLRAGVALPSEAGVGFADGSS